MKKIYLIGFTIFLLSSKSGADIDLKKDKVIINNVEAFVYDKKGLGNEFSLFTIDGKTELIYGKRNDNGTRQYKEDDYVTLKFLEQKLTVDNYRFGYSTWKKIIEIIYENKVFTEDFKINEEALNVFVEKYNENITNRTIITR